MTGFTLFCFRVFIISSILFGTLILGYSIGYKTRIKDAIEVFESKMDKHIQTKK